MRSGEGEKGARRADSGFDFITIQDELTEIFDRRVDLHTPTRLSTYFRADVLDSARDLYDAA